MTAELATPTGAPFFHYQAGELRAEGVSLAELGQELGTPLYVYSRGALAAAWASYQEACVGHEVLVCFGMKANSNLAVLKEFARLGSGFDIVSGGELERVMAAGGDPRKCVFAGVGKTARGTAFQPVAHGHVSVSRVAWDRWILWCDAAGIAARPSGWSQICQPFPVRAVHCGIHSRCHAGAVVPARRKHY